MDRIHIVSLMFFIFVICHTKGTDALLDDIRWGCPLPNFDRKFCAGKEVTHQCNTTADCFSQEESKHTLCCVTDCGGTKCIESPKKKGICPVEPTGVHSCNGVLPAVFKCGVDSECSGRQKCCYNGCKGPSCYDPKGPERRKLGCPFPTSVKPSDCTKQDDECIFDDDCQGDNSFCCLHDCGHNYCRRVKNKKGKCSKPPMKSGFCKPSDKQITCGVDTDCPGKEKCCPGMCGSTKCTGICKDDPKWRGVCNGCSCKKLKRQEHGVKLQMACMSDTDGIMLGCCESCKDFAGFFAPF